MIGTNFGPYRIDEKLGQGGMGVVYKAYDTTLQRPVAIKMIIASHKDALGSSSEARFMREARVASRLQHPAIVTIYQFGVENDTQYIVMEYVEGRSLRKIINDEPVPLEQLYEIGIQTAEALAAAHEAHIIHRDMKADNIMVTSKGQVKILDFGLAKLKDPVVTSSDGQSVFVTQPGIALGTVSHMSPEQAMGKEVDGKTDVFAMGVILYHMATGRLPFSGPNPTVTMLKILEGEADPVRQHNPYVPQGLEELIHRCLQKPSVERPTSAEVAEGLKVLRAGVMVPTPGPAAVRPQAAAAAAAGAVGVFAGAAAPPVGAAIGVREPSPAPGTVLAAPVPVGIAPPVPAAVAPAVAPGVAPKPNSLSNRLYWIVRATRIAVSAVLVVAAVVLLAYFVIVGEPTVRRTVGSTGVFTAVKMVAAPPLAAFHDLVPWKLTQGRWDFACLILAFLLLTVRGFAGAGLWNWEERLKRKRAAGRR